MLTERRVTNSQPTGLNRQRIELEAKLLAYRSGWLAFDEIRIRKLERALEQILRDTGEDPLARALIER